MRKMISSPSLQTNTIDYRFVGDRKQVDDAGRLLVWEATVAGAIGNEMRWWFYDPPPAPVAEHTNITLAYYRARWEIWSDEALLLAGESAGKTAFASGSDGVWDGHGVVTEARADFETLIGHRIFETGPVVVGSNPPLSYTGRGIFVVY